MSNIITVSGLNLYAKTLLESDSRLKNIWLKGEVSNLTSHYRSGHMYLTLKDEHCSIKAVMFVNHVSQLSFRPQDGMKVLVRGRITLYDVTGSYQINIEEMQPDGIGTLSMAFEQLKVRLQQEGLFDTDHKKPLPPYPQRIGVITSPTGAALQDIIRILRRRYPLAEILLYPVTVQGNCAAAELTAAVTAFDQNHYADVIIIGRGGGSIEDLWAFNDEGLARAIYRCHIPVVSAVGHETDFTICDFVSDVRASTPSAGAELVSPELSSMLSTVQYTQNRLTEAIHARLASEKIRLDRLRNVYVLRSPQDMIQYPKVRLDALTNRLMAVYNKKLSSQQQRFSGLSAKLETLSPLKVLSRGYAITKKQQIVIHSVRNVSVGDQVTITLSDGTLTGTVTDKKENPNG